MKAIAGSEDLRDMSQPEEAAALFARHPDWEPLFDIDPALPDRLVGAFFPWLVLIGRASRSTILRSLQPAMSSNRGLRIHRFSVV